MNKKNFEAYQDRNSSRTFKVFQGRGHFICGEPGWQEVADYTLDWLKKM